MSNPSPDRTPRPRPRPQAVQKALEQATLPALSSPLSSVRLDLSPLHHTDAVESSAQHVSSPDASSSDASPDKSQQANPRLPRRVKLEKTLELLSNLQFSLGDFLESYLTDTLPTRPLEVGRRRNIFKTALERTAVSAAAGIDNNAQNSLDCLDLQKEFEALMDEPMFGQYDPTSGLAEVNIEGSEATLVEKAPQWSSFLSAVLQNKRGNWNSYSKSKRSLLKGQAYLITSIILRSRARKRCNYLSRLLGLYLHGSGTKRRVIETLSGLGICDSYKVVNQMVTKVADRTELL